MVANEPRDFDQTIVEACEDASQLIDPVHIRVCPRCGQRFDSRISHQVIYHDQPVHKPIEPYP
jgi:hypothetical protein